jgi:intein/homing endonuclease
MASEDIVPVLGYRDYTKLGYDKDYVYDSFSGADIVAEILLPNEDKPLTLGELQTISYSIHRENKPVRTIGRVNPRGFVRGPRCLPASSKVLIKDRGYISIADVNPGDYVQSSGFTYDKVLGSFNQGFKKCYNLVLKDGYSLTASYDHPIYTDRGWVQVNDLNPESDRVHVAAYAPSPEEEYEISDSLLKIIAYLIGDGTTRRYEKKDRPGCFEHRISLEIADSEMASIGLDSEISLNIVGAPFRDSLRANQKSFGRVISVCKPEKGKTDWNQREYNDLHAWLLKLNLYDRYSHNKFIPQEFIVGLSKRQIALFLRHLFATDGHYSVEAAKGRLRVGYVSTSEELIDEIRLMLVKLGIRAQKRFEPKVGKVGGRENIVSKHDSYRLVISGKENVRKFYDKVGIFGKDERVSHLIDRTSEVQPDTDTIPMSIVSLTESIDLPVYDLEVENRHAFICDFIKVHNTIAGSLIFTVFNGYAFYRLEQYKNLIERKGGIHQMYPLSDMLPPFDVALTFSNEYGKFAKMRIYGVTIVDEGGTMSIEDLVTEQTFTYVARGIQPLTPFVPEGFEYTPPPVGLGFPTE